MYIIPNTVVYHDVPLKNEALKVKNNSQAAIKYFEKCRGLNPGSPSDLLEEVVAEARGAG